MVANGGAQILEFAARGRLRTALFGIGLATRLVQIGELLVTEIIEKAIEPVAGVFWPRVLRRNILGVDRDYVCDPDLSWVTVARSRRGFFVEVVAEGCFSFCSFVRACASGSLD